MSSYTQLLYHVVWSTKDRSPVLVKPNRTRLFSYIAGCLAKRRCMVHSINGVKDHLHLLVSIHQSKSVASIVGEIKRASSLWIKEHGIIPEFRGWQKGYGAFTVDHRNKRHLIDYIVDQERHHKKVSFKDEYLRLLDDFGIVYDPDYLWV